jgi:predicted  nucleic acid-binding Zn-ribbon protein
MCCRNKQSGWLFIMALAICLLCGSLSHASGRLTSLERRFANMLQQYKGLQGQHSAQFQRVQAAARQISLLKRQARRGGLFAIPARIRLPRVRAEAQRLTNRMAALTQQLHGVRRSLKQTRRQLQTHYKRHATSLHARLGQRGLAVAAKRQLQLQLRQARARLKTLRGLQLQGTTSKKAAPTLKVQVDPLDGPRELRQKADRLKDAEDHIKRMMSKLKRKMKRIRKKLKRRKKERKLESWVDNSGDGFFNETSRNPRVVTGSRTSAKLRQRNADRAPGLRLANPTNAEANQPKQNTTNPDPAPAAPSNGLQAGAGNGRGTATPPANKGTNSDSAGNYGSQGVTKTQPRLGLNPTLQPRGMGTTTSPKGLTLNPKGTLAQQLRALALYKKHLKSRVKQLKKRQSTLLQRAKQLKKERRKRR